jgi:uncharacterized membrane protein YsdA (DUF1294 family)
MSLGVAVVLLLAACALLLLIAVDRTSRADAWRRIAEERRWNTERRSSLDP